MNLFLRAAHWKSAKQYEKQRYDLFSCSWISSLQKGDYACSLRIRMGLNSAEVKDKPNPLLGIVGKW